MGPSAFACYATSSPRALQGMKYLPAPCSLSFGKRGRTGGVTSTNWALNAALSEPRAGEMGTVVGGQRYKRSCHPTLIGPSRQGHLDLDRCKFMLPLEKRAWSFFFFGLARSSQLFQGLQSGPWAEFFKFPSKEKRRGSSANLHAKTQTEVPVPPAQNRLGPERPKARAF